MRNNSALYFDIWRKKDFKKLIKAYTKVAETHDSKVAMRAYFGDYLDRYVGGRGKYAGTQKQWASAYTLGRELGIFLKENSNSGYDLSLLAQATLTSKITLEEYLLIYLLNFNQLIDHSIVHPLKEVLMLFQEASSITKEDIKNIPSFNLSVRTESSQNQQINILIHRMIEAEILKKNSNELVLADKYDLSDLLENINEFEGTAEEFSEKTHTQFVEMLSTPVKLIPNFKVGV